MLSVPLIAFGITHLTDARYFAAWEASYLCFPVGPSGLSLEQFHAIRDWVEGPVCVAELGADAGAGAVPQALGESGITHIMLDYGTSADPFRAAGVEVLTRVPVAGYESALDVSERLQEIGGTIVLDFTEGGITWTDLVDGHPFSTGVLTEMTADRSIFIRIDLTPDEAASAVQATHGLAFRGSSEEKVGYKSFDDIDGILEALEG